MLQPTFNMPLMGQIQDFPKLIASCLDEPDGYSLILLHAFYILCLILLNRIWNVELMDQKFILVATIHLDSPYLIWAGFKKHSHFFIFLFLFFSSDFLLISINGSLAFLINCLMSSSILNGMVW